MKRIFIITMSIAVCLLIKIGISHFIIDKTEFIQLKLPFTNNKITHDVVTNSSKYFYQVEFIIISNPPWTQNELKKIVYNYCRDFILLPNVDKYKQQIIFLKETKSTPRDYLETSKKYNTIQDHYDDKIITVNFQSGYDYSEFRYKKKVVRVCEVEYIFYGMFGKESKRLSEPFDESIFKKCEVNAVQKPGPCFDLM